MRHGRLLTAGIVVIQVKEEEALQDAYLGSAITAGR